MPLLMIESAEGFQAEIAVDESLSGRLKIGAPVLVSIEALNRQMTGKIAEILPAIDPLSRSFTVKVSVSGPGLEDRSVRQGQDPQREKTGSPGAPAAIVEKGQLTGVYAVDGQGDRHLPTGPDRPGIRRPAGDSVGAQNRRPDHRRRGGKGRGRRRRGKIRESTERPFTNGPIGEIIMEGIGISGKIAKAFIKSKLTPLDHRGLTPARTSGGHRHPREEEPQILVPMIDIFVAYPGASPREVEARVTKPMEKLLWEIKGVEYVYSIVKPGFNLTIVRFYVGQSMEESIVNLNNKLRPTSTGYRPAFPSRMIKQRSIDDVPILTLTLWSDSDRTSGYELRRIGAELCDEIKKDQDVSEFSLIGGQKRQVRITLEPARLKAYHMSAFQITGALQKANFLLPSGSFPAGNREYLVETGAFLKTGEEVGNVVTGIFNGRPVYLRECRPDRRRTGGTGQLCLHGAGSGGGHERESAARRQDRKRPSRSPIAKKKGANASLVAPGGPGQGGGPEGEAHPGGCERHRHPELRRHGQGEDPTSC